MKPNSDDFASRLSDRRVARGLSFRALGQAAGIAGNRLADYESRKVSPCIDRVAALADALEEHPARLAFGVEVSDAPYFRDLSPEGFGTRLRAARVDAKLRQEDLAKVAELTQRSIGQMEAGERLPRVDTVQALAMLLRVGPAWLAFGVGGPVAV